MKKLTTIPRKRAASATEIEIGGLKLTNLAKVMFPEGGYTKGDVLEYYAKVAPLLLPHLRDRPVTLERLPDGVRDGAPRFWQKRTPDYYPSWIPRVEMPTADGARVKYTLVNDEKTLLYLVNQGALTFHVWLSRVKQPDRPDYVLFDLDPAEKGFANIVKIAKEVFRILEHVEDVRSCVKTSGKRGLHVMVPWRQRGGFDEARGWAMGIAREVAKRLPEIATIERSIAARGGRAYVDVMQNAKGKHVVPPYVLRTVVAATVSTPLKWAQVSARLNPGSFDLKTAMQRFARQRKDLMQEIAGKA